MAKNIIRKGRSVNVNKTHSKIETNIDEKTRKTEERILKLQTSAGIIGCSIVGLTLLLGPVIAFCKIDASNQSAKWAKLNREIDCNISDPHLHYFKYPNGLETYFYTEEVYPNYNEDVILTDKIKYITDEETDFYRELAFAELININDNIDVINKILETNKDHIEYETSSTDVNFIPNAAYLNYGSGLPYIYTEDTHYWWSSDPNVDSKTGRIRECHYKYYVYKVEKGEQGWYVNIESDPLEDFSQRPEGYDYIKPVFYTIEYTESNVEELNNQR